MYISGLIPMGTLSVRIESCLPPAFLPGFPGKLTSSFQGLLSWGDSLGNHTEQSPISPPFLFVMAAKPKALVLL